jgi:hypothetical protein
MTTRKRKKDKMVKTTEDGAISIRVSEREMIMFNLKMMSRLRMVLGNLGNLTMFKLLTTRQTKIRIEIMIKYKLKTI